MQFAVCNAMCSFRDKCNSSREVQRLSARCAEPQHRRLFRTKSIKHRTPPIFLGPNFGACHFFHQHLNRASNPLITFSQPNFVLATFCPPGLSKFIFASTGRVHRVNQGHVEQICFFVEQQLKLWSLEFSPGSPLSL